MAITRDPMHDWIYPGYVGEAWANNRKVIVTKSGVCIGLLHEPPQKVRNSAQELVDEVLMHRRPLWLDKDYVDMMCKGEIE